MADCIFCKIASGTIPAKLVHETDAVLAFNDIHPAAPVHVLFISKKHIPTANDLGQDDESVFSELAAAAVEVASDLGVDKTGYRLVVNCGGDGGQEVFHLHMHLLAGRKLGKMG